MMHQTDPNAEELFFAALELENPEARARFLDRRCGDARLRREVEELLACDARASAFLEVPAVSPESEEFGGPLARIESVGADIGPYKLLEPLGEGGMGTVYMAEQTEPVRRRVALKVIKPGMDSKPVVARFEAERQALALMDHPNIAKVHDGGMTPSGRPYFVMELVRGLSITDYCDQEQLSISERLELFVLVCRAVQHAHQKGVIHRDLKPTNVLVTVIDGVPVPKVIDFGVAKAAGQALTDRTLFTGFHQFVGTPLYTSPEQADLSGVDVDTRSDVYSLGVLLYELLTGTTPFESETLKHAAFDVMCRIIREDEPPRPSMRLSSLGERLTSVSARRRVDPRRLGSALKGELDWVAMKALEKDRRRRYQTANDFAADVTNYLVDRPVAACSPSPWYRLTKFVRRNRSIVIPTAALALMALVGLAIGMGAVARERDEALAQRRQADARLRLAYRVVSKLRDVYPSLRSDFGPGATARLQGEVKEDLIRYYSQIIEANEGNPGVGPELGDAYWFLSSLYNPADRERRNWAFFKALAAYERAAKDRPDDATILNALAFHYVRLARRYLGSEPELRGATYRRAVDIYDWIARTHPDRVDDWVMSFLAATRYGSWLRGQGRSAEADALDQRVLSLFERPEIDLDWYVKAELQSAFGLIFLSELLVRCGRPLEAVTILDRVRPYILFAEQEGAYADALTNLGLALASCGDRSVATQAVTLASKEVDLSSGAHAEPWLLLGFALERLGDHQGATDAIRRAMELRGEESALDRFAWKLVSDPRVSDQPPPWLIDLARQPSQRKPEVGAYWRTLGGAFYRLGAWDHAIEAIEKSRSLDRESRPALNEFILAIAHWRRGDEGQARLWREEARAKMNVDDDELRLFRDEAAALMDATSTTESDRPGPGNSNPRP